MSVEMHVPRLPPLEQFRRHVTFRAVDRCTARVEDDCLLAVDVGSTTTKLILARRSDLAIFADWYGYTLGRPHQAIMSGSLALKEWLGETAIEIVGIAVSESGHYVGEAFLTD